MAPNELNELLLGYASGAGAALVVIVGLWLLWVIVKWTVGLSYYALVDGYWWWRQRRIDRRWQESRR